MMFGTVQLQHGALKSHDVCFFFGLRHPKRARRFPAQLPGQHPVLTAPWTTPPVVKSSRQQPGKFAAAPWTAPRTTHPLVFPRHPSPKVAELRNLGPGHRKIKRCIVWQLPGGICQIECREAGRKREKKIHGDPRNHLIFKCIFFERCQLAIPTSN